MEASTSALANEEQIRAIAYSIWEQAGRPAGQADWHWEMAKQATVEPKIAKPKAKSKAAAAPKRRASKTRASEPLSAMA